MPTFDAENQVRVSKESRPFVRVSDRGRLAPEVLEVLELIARHDLVLATGHSSPAENRLLIREARNRGVRRILVTHGMLSPVSMTAAQMKEAAADGASIEFVGNAVAGVNKAFGFGDYARAMREVGLDHCVLSSDFGQGGNPLHTEGLEQVFAGLRGAGLTPAEIERMAKTNPARLLGLE
jgi:microsomal dipeptidase-like Zn-dependent dipeptidase